jgi:protein-tyrosine phosphatase
MLLAGNRHFVEQQAARFGGVVRMLFDPSRRPAVVHCTAGKDRTGFAVACVLWALGADHEVVVGDYLRTNDLMQARHDRWLREATARGIAAEPLDAIMRVRREYIDAARDAAVARFGSVDRFVRDGLGVSDALRGAAREQLLVPR